MSVKFVFRFLIPLKLISTNCLNGLHFVNNYLTHSWCTSVWSMSLVFISHSGYPKTTQNFQAVNRNQERAVKLRVILLLAHLSHWKGKLSILPCGRQYSMQQALFTLSQCAIWITKRVLTVFPDTRCPRLLYFVSLNLLLAFSSSFSHKHSQRSF